MENRVDFNQMLHSSEPDLDLTICSGLSVQLLRINTVLGQATILTRSIGSDRSEQIVFVLRFYSPVNPMGSCRVRSNYLATLLLGRLSQLSG